ncbi:hypothetical protein [Chelativorans sp. M5D2P16]|uniref:hypothetical protein n=1 Tax=Chelativorans sp. M5D2P16 TaxID=3095678 RepID=UPI002ACAE28A|nr:hypothetical protein [Chelativorans sp. M5D2P16]MDZ5696821.1 hypothetical protein [Chelativorans sp. M5D2P16]
MQKQTPRQDHDRAARDRPHVKVAGRRIPVPRSRIARLGIGGALAVLGIFGFLPVLGFWMVPVGLLILSYDVAAVRRFRRRIEVWWHRRKEGRRGGHA